MGEFHHHHYHFPETVGQVSISEVYEDGKMQYRRQSETRSKRLLQILSSKEPSTQASTYRYSTLLFSARSCFSLQGSCLILCSMEPLSTTKEELNLIYFILYKDVECFLWIDPSKRKKIAVWYYWYYSTYIQYSTNIHTVHFWKRIHRAFLHSGFNRIPSESRLKIGK